MIIEQKTSFKRYSLRWLEHLVFLKEMKYLKLGKNTEIKHINLIREGDRIGHHLLNYLFV